MEEFGREKQTTLKKSERKQCHLFPLPKHPNDIMAFKRQSASPIPNDKLIKNFPWVCYLPGISFNIKLFHFYGNVPC